jgi:hypothetical protein
MVSIGKTGHPRLRRGRGSRKKFRRILVGVALGAALFGFSGSASAATVVEWTLADGTTQTSSGGALGATGVTVELRETATAHGTRVDVRLRNRSGSDYTHTRLRVRLARQAGDPTAAIEGRTAALPAELHQWWEASGLEAAKYGFAYEVTQGGQVITRVGPSTVEGQWGGRASGIVRIDGRAYVVPEFWQRQPRRISITDTEIVLTLFEGSVPLRSGEDAWDRYALLDTATLSDQEALAEAEGLPDLTSTQRRALLARFEMAPEGMPARDVETETLLRKYDLWQGTSWDKSYADEMPARAWSGEADATRTTLFSLFARGWYYPVADPGCYTWREYGDILWAVGKSNLHYDWLRAALKHYLKTGDRETLRWAMAAARHAVSVDHVWESPTTPAYDMYWNLAGLTRYEKGDHGGQDFMARPTHSWAEGLFLAAAVTGDSWVQEAAVDLAEADWRFWGAQAPTQWAAEYGETREITWPLLVQVVAFRETGNAKYWQKARELMAVLLEQEQRSGAKGYVSNSSPHVGNINNAFTLMNGYSTRGLIAFADEALARGEWTNAHLGLMQRWATWLSTPVPEGSYYPDGSYFATPDPAITWGTHVYAFCPPGKSCTFTTTGVGEPVYNIMAADLFAWLAEHDPSGRNPNTGQPWDRLCRIFFRDAVFHAVQPQGIVGFLTNQYPTTETKALGWIQLFCDRAALYFSSDASLTPEGGVPQGGGVTPTANASGSSGAACFIGALAPGSI